MKILHLDLETAPNLASVWGVYKQNIAPNQLHETSRVICFAAQWDDEDEVMFSSEFHYGHIPMIERLHSLLTEADAVVTYNGDGFDLPTANREFLLYSMYPPAPYKSIDLIRTIRSKFRFVMNKMDKVTQELGIGRKKSHEGHDLWIKCCFNEDADAWQRMREYNIQDVILTKELYHRILPWIEDHPACSLYIDDDKPRCRNCGSDEVKKEGFAYTKLGRYQQYSCKMCGTWGRGRKSQKLVEVR